MGKYRVETTGGTYIIETADEAPTSPVQTPGMAVTSADTKGGTLRNILASAAESMGGAPDAASSLSGMVKVATGALKSISPSTYQGPGLPEAQPISPMDQAKGLYEATLGRFIKGVQSGDPYEASGGVGASLPIVAPLAAGAISEVRQGMPTARKVANIATTPENLMLRSAEHQANIAASKAPSGIPMSKAGVIMRGASKAVNPIRRAVSAAEEGVAQWMSRDQVAPRFEAPPSPEWDTSRGEAAAQQSRLQAEEQYARELRQRGEDAQNRPPLESGAPVNAPRPQSISDAQFLEAERLKAQRPVVPDFRKIEEVIAPSGRFAKQSSQMVKADGTPTDFGRRLIQEVPELSSVRKGVNADAALMTGLDRTLKRVISAEDAIPRTVEVPRASIVEKLEEIAQDYVDYANPKTASAIDSVLKKWKEMPGQIPWEQFRDAKRAFFREANTKSAPMRRAYGVLMDAASTVSEDLATANKSYATVRRALDNAGIDIRTGRRISNVGKPQSLSEAARARFTR